MQKKLQSYHFIILSSLIYVLTCAIISAAFFSTWDADYGTVYSAAMYLGDTKRLYVDLFAHKGPAYFAFIQIFGKLFGWGEYKIKMIKERPGERFNSQKIKGHAFKDLGFKPNIDIKNYIKNYIRKH